MKNKFGLMFGAAVLCSAVLGCSFYNPLQGSSNSTTNDNRTLTDKTIDSTVDGEKIGIPECDEIVDFFGDQAKSEDDNYITKAARSYALSKVRESFKKSIEENKNDPAKMAKECRDFKKQLDKYKAEDDAKKNANR